MLPTLEIVGSAFLLDPHDALFGLEVPVVSVSWVRSQDYLCAWKEVDSGSLHEKLGSVLMVLILSSLFACEEPELMKNETEIDILSITLIFS